MLSMNFAGHQEQQKLYHHQLLCANLAWVKERDGSVANPQLLEAVEICG